MLSFLHKRVTDADHPRPYQIPGGLAIARLCAYACMLILGLTIVLFIFVPGDGIQWPVLIGVIVTLIAGEIVIRESE